MGSNLGPYGTLPIGAPYQIAPKYPGSILDYSENISQAINGPGTGNIDQVISLSLSIQPSGAGEISLSDLTLDETGVLVTWWEAAGVSGRDYLLNLEAVTKTGRQYQWFLGQLCSPVVAVYPLPPAPNPGFSQPITWTFVVVPIPSLNFTVAGNFGAWPFGCEINGPGVPVPPPVTPGPALVFDVALNFGAWPFGCQFDASPAPPSPGAMTGTATASSTTIGIISGPPVSSSLVFNVPLNFGAWPFGCQIS